MKTKTLVVFSVVFFFISFKPAMGQSQLFSGEWKLNKEKSTTQNDQLFLSKMTILQKNDSLFTNRVYENGNGESYPFKENLSLNGAESKISIYDMPRKAKASLSENNKSIEFESITTFYGNGGADDLKTKETWSVENEGKTLKMGYSTSYSGGTSDGTLYFDKVK